MLVVLADSRINENGVEEFWYNTAYLLESGNKNDFIDKINIKKVDIIVTSPPYGDSRTTVAYGQFSRLANQWLDIEDANPEIYKISGLER